MTSTANSKNYRMLAILIGMGFIAAFNENTVNIALVNVQSEFQISNVTAQWMVSGYMIVSAIISATCAYMMSRFALRKLVFCAGSVFASCSIIAVFAVNFEMLLTFRLLQAIGTGMFVPIMMTTILKLAPKEKLGTLMSVGNMCLTLGPALGPAITGFMISSFGWRTVFVPGAVIMLVLLILGAFFVFNIHETQEQSLDVPSVILSSIGLTFFMYGLTQICLDIITSIWTLLLGSGILALFTVRQNKIPHPFLILKPCLNKEFAASCGMLGVAMMVSFSTTVLLPQYFQEGTNVSAVVTGGLILLLVMCNVVCAVLGGKLFDRFGEMPLLPIGYIFMCASVLGMSFSGLNLTVVSTTLFACLTFVTLALVYTATQASGLKRLCEHEHAHGVAIMNVLVMVAGAFGTSVCSGISQAASAAAIAEGATSSVSQGIGFCDAMLVVATFTFCAFLLSFVFRKRISKAPICK